MPTSPICPYCLIHTNGWNNNIAKVKNWTVVALVLPWTDNEKGVELINELGWYTLKLQFGVQNWKANGSGPVGWKGVGLLINKFGTYMLKLQEK